MASKSASTGKRFDTLEQEAFLGIWRTYDRLRALEDELFARYDLTAQQYNALRLLRSCHPEAIRTLDLAARLVSRAPDITRLLDKLEQRPGCPRPSGRQPPRRRCPRYDGRNLAAQRAAKSGARLPRTAAFPPFPKRPHNTGCPAARLEGRTKTQIALGISFLDFKEFTYGRSFDGCGRSRGRAGRQYGIDNARPARPEGEALRARKFPRFHIGESLIPETYWVFKRLNMLEKMKASPFVKKFSVQFVNAAGKESAPFYFHDNKPHECSQTWQVIRSEFDTLMLDNARQHGVEVIQPGRVEEILFEGDRAVGAGGE